MQPFQEVLNHCFKHFSKILLLLCLLESNRTLGCLFPIRKNYIWIDPCLPKFQKFRERLYYPMVLIQSFKHKIVASLKLYLWKYCCKIHLINSFHRAYHRERKNAPFPLTSSHQVTQDGFLQVHSGAVGEAVGHDTLSASSQHCTGCPAPPGPKGAQAPKQGYII